MTRNLFLAHSLQGLSAVACAPVFFLGVGEVVCFFFCRSLPDGADFMGVLDTSNMLWSRLNSTFGVLVIGGFLGWVLCLLVRRCCTSRGVSFILSDAYACLGRTRLFTSAKARVCMDVTTAPDQMSEPNVVISLPFINGISFPTYCECKGIILHKPIVTRNRLFRNTHKKGKRFHS